jgi:hypothetical protein
MSDLLQRPTGESASDERAQAEEPLVARVRHRLINIGSLTWPLRLFVALTLVQLVLVGGLNALHDLPQPMVGALVGGSHAIALPSSAFVVGLVSFTLALSAILTGALHGHWVARILAILLFAVLVFVALGDVILTTTDPTTQELRSPFNAQLLWLPLLALPVLVAIWALVVGLVTRARARTYTGGGPLIAVSFFLMIALTIACFALAAGYLALSGRAEAFPTIPADELWLLSYLLLPALLFSGTDYAEWGEAIAARLTRTRRRPTLAAPTLALLTALLSGAIFFGVPVLILLPGIRLAGSGLSVSGLLLDALILGITLLGVLATLVWLGRMRRWPRLRVSFGGLFFSTLAVTFAVTLASLGGPLGVILGIALWPVLGIALVIRGRWRPGSASAVGAYLIVVGLAVFVFALGIVAAGQNAAAALGGVQMVVALVTLGALAWLAARGRLDIEHAPLISLYFVLNVGLLLIGVIYVLLANVATLSRGFGLVPAVLVVAAFLWDFLTSGEEVTNVEGRAFPRAARVLLYAGYIMLISAIVLFFAPVTPNSIFDQQDLFFVFSADLWPRYGLLLLGVPLLLTNFLLAWGHWRGRNDPPPAPIGAAPTTPRSPAYPPPYPPPYPPHGPAYQPPLRYPPQPGQAPPSPQPGAYPPAGYPPAQPPQSGTPGSGYPRAR